MASRNLRKNRHQRFSYVDPACNNSNYSSTDEDRSPHRKRRNKVRHEKSLGALFRQSTCIVKSDEHSYTQTTSPSQDACGYNGYEHDAEVSKKTRCESKNAINARINREKKKAYIMSMEDNMKHLQSENLRFSTTIDSQKKIIKELKHELTYYKNILGNNPILTALVSKLNEVTGLPVSSSIVAHSQSSKEKSAHARVKNVSAGQNHPIAVKDVNFYCPPSPSVTGDLCGEFSFTSEKEKLSELSLDDFLPYDYAIDSTANFGICVHVNQERLSVEFCSVCNSMAAY